MIERIYIDNFRTLVNCEIKLQSVSLLLGANGAGKSSVFDAVELVKYFVGGAGPVWEVFPSSSLTRWQTLDEQTFELDLRGQEGVFRYALKIKHASDRRQSRVASESLSFDGRPLFTSKDGEAQLYNDNYGRGPVMTFDWNRSALPAIYSRPDNRRLTEFKERLAAVYCVRPCPALMLTDSQEEADVLSRDASNFASWYRYVLRQDISRQGDLFRELEQVIEGFQQLLLDGPADGTISLRVLFSPPDTKASMQPGCVREQPEPDRQFTLPMVPYINKTMRIYKFGELSEGQRQLILLYTLLCGLSDTNRVLLFDEPDNYVSLREIQPWLTALMDATGRSISQSIIISHHPEVIDHLAREKGIWFTRDSAGPTRVGTDKDYDNTLLKPSEVEARGW